MYTPGADAGEGYRGQMNPLLNHVWEANKWCIGMKTNQNNTLAISWVKVVILVPYKIKNIYNLRVCTHHTNYSIIYKHWLG